MELKKLAFFFEELVESYCEQLSAFLIRQNTVNANDLLFKVKRSLQFKLFDLTHKTLISHYKSIQEEVSFEGFCESLKNNQEVKEYFYQRYPVMERRLETICNNWLEQTSRIVHSFHQDKQVIQAKLFKTDVDFSIESIQFGLGDQHRKGKSVSIVKFSNGERLVYKPRSLSIDIHFSSLLEWVNQLTEFDLKVPETINNDEYGWVKFIPYDDCKKQSEIDRFYERLGAYTGLLYLLNGTDFHYENIIACGEHPILIDLESFFHPDTPHSGDDREDSVLMTGILPSDVELGDEFLPDISGMTDVEGTEGIFDSMVLVPDGKGEYEFTRTKGHLAGAENIPKLNGEKVKLSIDNVTQFKEGFRHVYHKILINLDEFKRQLLVFRQDNIRVLFRFTACYSYLLTEANHPSVMSSTQKEYEHFNKLAVTIQDNTIFGQIIENEIVDMQRLDVPLFTTKVDSRHLWYSDNDCLEDFFECSGYDKVLHKLQRLSVNDLNYQLWIIDNSLSLQSELKAEKTLVNGKNASSLQTNKPIEQRLLEAATKVADYIEEQLHEDDKFASWMVVRSASIDNSKLGFSPAALDLYAGMPGEILFLTCFGQYAGIERYTEIAVKAYNLFLSKIENTWEKVDSLGLYYGWGAVIRTFTQLAKITNDQRYYQKIEDLFELVNFEALIAADTRFALIKGSAGFMLACSEYHIESQSPEALRLAKLSAQHLLANRQRDLPGYSWRISSAVPLSGMAHGASGFAMAFAKLYQASEDNDYLQASLKSLEYERTLFVPEQQNWRDCRDLVIEQCGEEAFCSVGWSHGAPGIGLARIALMQSGVKDDVISNELAIAIDTTIKSGFEGNDSLIYGGFGNLDLLLSSYHYLGDDYRQPLMDAAAKMLDRIDSRGWDLGDKNVDSFGLMIGVTGIGYQCLRMLYQDKVPSLLASTR